MIKRSLLATSIAMALVQQATAAPLLPMDARGLAMGSTGVASAKLAHAPLYNPALLSTANDEDDFAIIFPQIGIVVADEDEFIDTAKGLTDDKYKSTNESLIDHFTTIAKDLNSSLNTLEDQISTLNGTLDKDLTSLTPAELNNIKTSTTQLETGLKSFTAGTQDLKTTTFDLTTEMDKLSGNGLRFGGGVNGAIAIPSKTFAAAISISANAFASGRTIFTPQDQNLINAYAEGVNEYSTLTTEFVGATNSLITSIDDLATGTPTPGEVAAVNLKKAAVDKKRDDLNSYTKQANGANIISINNGTVTVNQDPQLTSQAQIVAVAVADLGLTLSSNFNIKGHDIAIGITPKLQTVKTYDYTVSVADKDKKLDAEDIKDTESSSSNFNIDMGVAYQFGDTNQWQTGLVAKNLVSKEYETKNNLGQHTKISLDTQFRAGLSHTTDWTVVAVDVDLMENDPVAFESKTQYASIGAEFDLFDTLQLRAGYRKNLSASDSSVASVGFGLSPFGVHFDLAAMANPSDPKKEAGVAMEFGFYF